MIETNVKFTEKEKLDYYINKEKLSYTLEEDHYSIPTIPKARRQPAASLIGALWR